MLFILQTGISDNLHLEKGLQKIYGVGQTTAKLACHKYGLLEDIKGKDLRRLHRLQLKGNFNDFTRELGADLKQIYIQNCANLIQIDSYKGRRHRIGYPVRGQRTHTNAKTQKRLYIRWKTNTYDKPKNLTNKKVKVNVKSKKAKTTSKSKPSQKAKPAATKSSKYKI